MGKNEYELCLVSKLGFKESLLIRDPYTTVVAKLERDNFRAELVYTGLIENNPQFRVFLNYSYGCGWEALKILEYKFEEKDLEYVKSILSNLLDRELSEKLLYFNKTYKTNVFLPSDFYIFSKGLSLDLARSVFLNNITKNKGGRVDY